MGSFGGSGHAGPHAAASVGFSGPGHAPGNLGPDSHHGIALNNPAIHAGGFGSGEHFSSHAGGNQIDPSPGDFQSFGLSPAAGHRMTTLIFPISPALLSSSVAAPVPNRSGFIQHQVLAAASGRSVTHHDGGQRVPSGEQYRQAGQAGGQRIADNRQELVKPQVPGPGGPEPRHFHGHHDWLNRSYFFGASSPFDMSSDNSGGTFVYYGYGFGFGLGYGLGYLGSGYGGGYAVPTNGNMRPMYALYSGGAPRVRLAAAQFDDEVPADQVESALSFAEQGEVDFKQGKYKLAAQSWRHALVDDPRNAAIVLLLGQALFAVGQYDEAAGATQAALSMLPEDKWGAVVTHYKELYPNVGDYTGQIRALEKARDAKPDAPALHFLLGYHFGYLNYPKHAVRELDKVLAAVPKDKIAQKLRDEFAAKLSDADKAALEKQATTPADDGKPVADKEDQPKSTDEEKSDSKDDAKDATKDGADSPPDKGA
jgi:tetratricopeptide (TPR) repeat protein